ncbi:MAG: hypothetical protein HYY30_07705 [Chloroflexi bacterium]|nr:hypothetical protein [Chloroflexota bacterium]
MEKTIARTLTHREFLKMCGLAILGAGTGQMVVAPKPVSAADGSFDNLTVTGNALLATTGGRVGIGTASPGAKLDVRGDFISLMPGSAWGGYVLTDTNAGWISTLKVDANGYGYFHLGNSVDSYKVVIRANGSSYFKDGNVGIGTDNPNPDAKLEVRGGSILLVPGSAWGGYVLTDTNAGWISTLKVDANGYGYFHLGNSVDSYKVVIQGNGPSYFNGGNVGIGTANPGAKLHLYDGAIRIGQRVIADDGGSYYA